jgi:predicted ATPase
MFEQERLDLNAKHWWLFGREREVAVLEDVMERAKCGSRELVFIEGPTGTGKASIVQHLSHGRKSLFASGKFDSNRNSPFAAIVSACDQLISCIYRDKTLKHKMSKSMFHEMNDTDIASLFTFLPKAQDLMDDSGIQLPRASSSSRVLTESNIDDKKNLLTKIKFAVRAFLRMVTKHSNCPLILCLQQLECADDASMEIVEFVADDREQVQFIVAATVTLSVENTGGGHLVQVWKQRVSKSETMSKITTVISVDHLNLEHLNTFLSVVTRMKEAETLPLATHLMTRTTGNLFTALQILEEWQYQCLITYDNSLSRWQWDLEKVQNTAVPENLVDLVSNRIRHLPSQVQRALKLGACLGYVFEPTLLDIIKEALPGEPLDVESVLELCVEEGLLVDQSDGCVAFLHSSILQASLLHLPQGDDSEKLHLRIGLLIWNHLKGIRKQQDWMLFLCADHLAIGSNHIDDETMMLEVAELCNRVGKTAVEISAFTIAAVYFAKGIEMLNKIHCSKWEDFHELTQSLFVSFAEIQYYNGKFSSSVEAIEELLANDPSEPAFVRTNLTRLEILKAECKLKEFVDASLAFLKELGVDFPSHFTKAHDYLERRRVTEKLNGMDDATIINLPRVGELHTIVVLKVLNQMTVPVETLGLVRLSSLIVHKAVRFSITHGVSELSPQAFVLLGTFLISERGMLAEGYRMGQLALKMSHRLNPSILDGRVVAWAYSMTIPWQGTPLAECVPPLLQGHASAMKQGDPFTAFMLINIYFSVSYFSSNYLPLLLQDVVKYSNQMLEYGQKTIFLQILPIWQCMLNLSDLSADPCDMDSGEAMDKQKLVGNENDVGEQARWSFLMQIAYYMGNFELASRMSVKLQSLNIGFMKAHVLYQVRVFFFGLIAIENARSSGKRKFIKEAAQHISEMRSWVEKRAVNLEHKLLILEAEYDSLSVKNGVRLQSRYDAAITASTRDEFVQDAALAAQLAGRALLQFEDKTTSAKSYFISAYETWVSWGAFAVAKGLEEKLRDRYPGISLDLSQVDSASEGILENKP